MLEAFLSRSFLYINLLTRYPTIKYVEGWNEPWNAVHHWTGTVAEMVIVQQTLYNAVKAINPSIAVLSPPSGGAGTSTDQDSFTGLAKDYFDIFAQHFYANSDAARETFVDEANTIMSDNGISDMELWNTETGFVDTFGGGDLGGFTAQEQADKVTGLFTQMRGLGVMTNIFFIWNDLTGEDIAIDGTEEAIAAWNAMQ